VPTTARPIRPLPPLLASQIAAGEVIERPASVVKELLENSLDAGATRLSIDLELGGIELIRITDDAHGIPPSDLPLALAPHATSKIAHADDLDRIATLGFRGEALASIASVARVTIRSRTPDNDAASTIDAQGDTISPVKPAAGPVGTCITVRNLFFNTPARRKFLRTPATEQGKCLDWIKDLAMARPAVAFRATCDGRAVLDLPADHGPRERALAILGQDLADQLIDVHADQFDDTRGLALWGLIGLPSLARPTAAHQRVFLNGRLIRDKTIQHAVKEAYRGLVEPGRHPTAVLMLEMSPSAVDVNVHPAKLEVRFRDSSMVHQAVLAAIRRALQSADLTPAIGTHAASGASRLPGALPGQSWSLRPGANDLSAERFASFLREPKPTLRYDDLTGLNAPLDAPVPPASMPGSSLISPLRELRALRVETDQRAASHAPTLPTPLRSNPILQVHKSFVVTEDSQGVVIVDQHALHERVMFERLLDRITHAPLEGQQLLTPTLVPVTPQRLALLDTLRPMLDRLGVRAEPLGPRDIAVHCFPSFLFERGVDPAEFLDDLLDKAERDDFVATSEEALRDVLDMMACKAAVKAGDELSQPELHDLLALRETVERSSNCPHGRPTSIRLTIHQLERLFGRT